MRTLVFITTLFASISSYSQVICGTANENGTVTLTAPPNNTFTSIEFASYGTPNGGCNSFVLGTCHAANSQSIVEGVFIGQNSASIAAILYSVIHAMVPSSVYIFRLAIPRACLLRSFPLLREKRNKIKSCSRGKVRMRSTLLILL